MMSFLRLSLLIGVLAGIVFACAKPVMNHVSALQYVITTFEENDCQLTFDNFKQKMIKDGYTGGQVAQPEEKSYAAELITDALKNAIDAKQILISPTDNSVAISKLGKCA